MNIEYHFKKNNLHAQQLYGKKKVEMKDIYRHEITIGLNLAQKKICTPSKTNGIRFIVELR